ncbi:AraC family transcriptional regulator [Maribacter sp. HTCC2170]|uniref:AraC family transcriptional regulator n=1 Tax=Maribacter sp. (strain HTCC2170 / KCCM 42371) TaxID=313603 RepID=UPI00030B6E7C|nr:AraC family transcriptional regulator [Maribacter sp. HTCC2170]
MDAPSKYQEIKPSQELENFVHSFWMHKNLTSKFQRKTIVPDSYFKIVIVTRNDKVLRYLITGLWTFEKPFTIPSNSTVFGCRLKMLAPEFLLNREVASVLQDIKQLDLKYLNADNFNLSDFATLVKQWETELLKIKVQKEIPGSKLRLSQLLDKMNGDISTAEVSNQIYWTNRQINRYLNKYLGVSLKKYLNIQKCYQAYLHIRDGNFYPEKGYFDQPHFIREIKKHTGETPKSLHKSQNDRFIQLKRISKK